LGRIAMRQAVFYVRIQHTKLRGIHFNVWNSRAVGRHFADARCGRAVSRWLQ
jgi:hypothetical protein